ncbi:uncharacterized protein A1O5_00906 [Cladophialophora psammophila CBS 110553]|uniref:Ketoreductase domain-containing protein n=1 Tax=Cladophialophora psammophila CBS 110553 TaxID=1182543 RepID=W9X876_9EURO|nr:uncharacterized protein A1O5_00906 [Cladophialophora psammophila CBS 110553]EXJ76398.1 hypothetical protein A1O5_00906 [Cladophialophora psammophila CBS 110553]
MSRPSLNTDPYALIAPETLVGVNRGKTAVVTGAARGIGKAIAESLAKTGADLALLDLDTERQLQTQADCEQHGVKARRYACDVTNLQTCQEVFEQIVRDLGPVDILVNNAGRNSRRVMAMETFQELWAGVELNLKGAMICLYQVLPSMRRRGHGCIINIASRAGTVVSPFAGAYSIGKAGLIRATGVWQAELELDGFGDNIHLYALHPGAVKTEMTVPPDPDIEEKYPEFGVKWRQFHQLFKVSPALCGQTCAFLSAGKAKLLRGKYFDCEQDIGTVLAVGEQGLKGLYDLKVEFLGGLPNDGGTALAVVEGK